MNDTEQIYVSVLLRLHRGLCIACSCMGGCMHAACIDALMCVHLCVHARMEGMFHCGLAGALSDDVELTGLVRLRPT